MTIRKIMPQDFPSIERGNFLCWEGTGSYSADPPETIAQKRDGNAANSRDDKYWRETWVALDDDGETVISHMRADPYRIFFDGQSVPMAGVGGVWTLPHHRRRGAVRALFAKAFGEMRERGQIFSTLFPFAPDYYRKFGYGACHTFVEWIIPFKSLKRAEPSGTIENYRAGDDIAPYKGLYDAIAPLWNGMMDREDVDWVSLRNLDPAKRVRYAYLWRDGGGSPGGYFIHGKETRDGVRLLDCGGAFAAKDAQAVRALLGCIAAYADWYDAVRFTLPPDFDLLPFLHGPVMNEGSGITRTLRDSAQTRIVDLPAALKLCRTAGGGALTLGVTDNACPWNHGVWRVEWEGGGVTSAEPSGGSPDISMDIADVSAALMGAWDARQLAWNPNISIHGGSAPLGGLFYRKPWQTQDTF
jgi:predicted acetyltransferase